MTRLVAAGQPEPFLLKQARKFPVSRADSVCRNETGRGALQHDGHPSRHSDESRWRRIGVRVTSCCDAPSAVSALAGPGETSSIATGSRPTGAATTFLFSTSSPSATFEGIGRGWLLAPVIPAQCSSRVPRTRRTHRRHTQKKASTYKHRNLRTRQERPCILPGRALASAGGAGPVERRSAATPAADAS